MKALFGTDSICGAFGLPLVHSSFALRLGWALAHQLGEQKGGASPTLLLGRDTRASGAPLSAEDLPIVVGVSRKSMIGALCERPQIRQRLAGGLALATLAVERGANIVRSHNVRATVDALRVTASVVCAA